MTELYAMPPADAPHLGPGYEHSFPQILRFAWTRFTARFWSAVGYGLLLAIILVGIALAWFLVGIGVFLLLTQAWHMSAATAMWTSLLVIGIPAYATYVAAAKLLFEGFLRAAIETYDGTPITFATIFRPLRRPWRRPMFAYIALLTPILLAVHLVLGLFGGTLGARGLPIIGGAGGAASSAAVLLGAHVIDHVAQATILSFILFIGQFILNSSNPSLRNAIDDQVRVLKHQWRRVVAVCGLHAAAAFLLNVPQLLTQAMMPANPFVGCVALPFAVVHGLMSLYFIFLVAALFRSIHGMPLEFVPPPIQPVPVMPLPAAFNLRAASPASLDRFAAQQTTDEPTPAWPDTPTNPPDEPTTDNEPPTDPTPPWNDAS
jgi:hypothetical protein